MTKKPETVKQEDLIRRKDGLYYVKYAKVPFAGTSKQFHTNGQLKQKGNYKNGELHGLCEYFDEDGKLTKTESWENGKLVK